MLVLLPVVLPLMGLALWIALRDRAWRSVATLLGCCAFLCGAAGDDHLTIGGSAARGRMTPLCGPALDYRGAAIDVTYRREMSDELDLYGTIGGFVGTRTAEEPDASPVPYYGGTAFVGVDHTWGKLDIGASFGEIPVLGDSAPWFPTASLRLGARHSVFLEGELGRELGGPFPGGMLQIMLGFGLPSYLPDAPQDAWNRPIVRVGGGGSGLLARVQLPLERRFGLDLRIGYADRDTWRTSAGLRWRAF